MASGGAARVGTSDPGEKEAAEGLCDGLQEWRATRKHTGYFLLYLSVAVLQNKGGHAVGSRRVKRVRLQHRGLRELEDGENATKRAERVE